MKTKQQVIVHLRNREVADGKQALYLDISVFGKRSKEALHMYYLPGKDRVTKRKNEETRLIAEAKAKRREEELNERQDGFIRGRGLDEPFFPYISEIISKVRNNGTRQSYECVEKHIHIYEKDSSITFRRINPSWVSGFKEYLNDADNLCVKGSKLSSNTAAHHFVVFKTLINHAIADNIITRNPCAGIKSMQQKPGTREHLTAAEIKMLIKSPCRHDMTKYAFLFSCMTGLRFSDISTLKWSNISIVDNDVYMINITQTKTGNIVSIPLNSQAVDVLKRIDNSNELVFHGLMTNNGTNNIVEEWVKASGIKKKITFHCARHTFACLALLACGNIYTTSSLLGHTSIKTTQIYAKVVDESRRLAVNKLNELL